MTTITFKRGGGGGYDEDNDEDDTLFHKGKSLSKSWLFHRSVPDVKYSNIQYSIQRLTDRLNFISQRCRY